MWRSVIEQVMPGVLLLWWGVIVTTARDNKVRRERKIEFRIVVNVEPFVSAIREMSAAFEKMGQALATSARTRRALGSSGVGDDAQA